MSPFPEGKSFCVSSPARGKHLDATSLAWKRWVEGQCSGPAAGEWEERLQHCDFCLLNAKRCPSEVDGESQRVSLQAEDSTVKEAGTRALFFTG